MGILRHFFILFVLLYSVAEGIEFKDMYKISLKKDEQTKILVKYRDNTKLFKFRWTLYQNEGLVVFHSYLKEVAQNILYLNTKNQSFKVYLTPKGGGHYEVPYFLVMFKAFDYEKNRAKFELFLADKEAQIKIEFLKND